MRFAAICVIVLVATGTITSAQKPTKDGVRQSRYESPKSINRAVPGLPCGRQILMLLSLPSVGTKLRERTGLSL